MYKNNIIELFPENIKSILYNAIEQNKNIMYSTNLRAVPVRTKEGIDNVYSISLDTYNIYNVVVSPDKQQLEYFDLNILDIKTAIEKDISIKELIEFLKDNNKSEFINAMESSPFSFKKQYDTEVVYNYILSIVETNNAKIETSNSTENMYAETFNIYHKN